VAEVAQEPPQPGGAAGAAVVVRDDEDALANPRVRRGRGKRARARQRVPPAALRREVGELVDPEERCAGDVLVKVGLEARLDPCEVVGAVDEPVDQ